MRLYCPILIYLTEIFSAVCGFICCKRRTRKIDQKVEFNIELQEVKFTAGTSDVVGYPKTRNPGEKPDFFAARTRPEPEI